MRPGSTVGRTERQPPAVVAIGGSLGAFVVTRALLAALPADFPVPLVIVHHRAVWPRAHLAGSLGTETKLAISEALDHEPLVVARAYLAPAGYHLLVERGHLALSVDPPVNGARPSIDVLLESAADAYGPDVLALVLTGTGVDGAMGAASVRARGGRVAIQEPRGADAPALPAAVRAAVPDAEAVAAGDLAAWLSRACGAIAATPAPPVRAAMPAPARVAQGRSAASAGHRSGRRAPATGDRP